MIHKSKKNLKKQKKNEDKENFIETLFLLGNYKDKNILNVIILFIW